MTWDAHDMFAAYQHSHFYLCCPYGPTFSLYERVKPLKPNPHGKSLGSVPFPQNPFCEYYVNIFYAIPVFLIGPAPKLFRGLLGPRTDCKLIATNGYRLMRYLAA